MLDFDSTLDESKEMAGPLGAAVFVVGKALEAGGASGEELEQFRLTAKVHFSALCDGDCNTLCDVLYHRLQEARSSKPDGRWYA